MLKALQRIRGMSGAELSWRAQTTARTLAQSAAVRVRPPRWERQRVAEVLSPSLLDPPCRAAIARGDWQYLQDALARRILGRPSRFVLDPAAARDVTAAVVTRWPDAPADAAARADHILKGCYDVLGYRGLEFGSPAHAVDWHFDPVHNRRAPRIAWSNVPYLDPAFGDHKIIWELNRHQHWIQLGRAFWLTGDQRYADGIIRLLESWLAANPPLMGINWASMLEIGFRSISWTWALHALLGNHEGGDLRGSSPWLVDILLALDRQLKHVEQNLSYYFSPNTHLTGEALALYVVGSALPELAASSRWIATGRRVLLAEIDRQILADGGHAERSMHYQRYMLDFYLLALNTAVQTGDADAIPPLRDAATRLAEFTRSMADEHGHLPLIGDDDGGMLWPIAGRECQDVRDSLALAAMATTRPELTAWGVPEEPFWIAGRMAVDRAPALEHHPRDRRGVPSHTFRDTGYIVVRDTAGGHAVLDAGMHGYMNGGHAHADALALTLRLGNRPFLVDPGTATYTMDPRLRDRMRSSMNHNTVVIDGRSQSIPAGPFHWQTRTDARIGCVRHNPAFHWVEATHDAYAPLMHRRSLLRAGTTGWLVIDEILGEGRHLATAHWHFDPAWMLKADVPGRMCARHLEGELAWLLHDGGDTRLVHGDEESGLGWFAPTYGTLLPTWAALVTRHVLAPAALVTWIGEGAGDGAAPPSLTRIPASGDSGERAIAATVMTGDVTSVYLARPGDTTAARCRVAGYDTDARAFHYEVRGDRLRAINMVDAVESRALREGWISVSSDAAVRDLHVSIDERDVMTLWACNPPPELRLDGALVRTLRGMTLNGREAPLGAAITTGVAVAAGGDWREITPRGLPHDHESVMSPWALGN
jgi:hypothetical protein